jgi:hypothetical protein
MKRDDQFNPGVRATFMPPQFCDFSTGHASSGQAARGRITSLNNPGWLVFNINRGAQESRTPLRAIGKSAY